MMGTYQKAIKNLFEETPLAKYGNNRKDADSLNKTRIHESTGNRERRGKG